MKNSIEEDIEVLEKMIKSYKEADKCGLSNNDFKNEIKALEHILSEYKRVLKENELAKQSLVKNSNIADERNNLLAENQKLKEKHNQISKEIYENLAFEKYLIREKIEPDLFNKGKFYMSQIVYDILNGVESPEGIHKENKYIKDIAYIPVQKIKEKIEELENANWYCESVKNQTIRALKELLEESEEK